MCDIYDVWDDVDASVAASGDQHDGNINWSEAWPLVPSAYSGGQ